jgi:hypothetical protein
MTRVPPRTSWLGTLLGYLAMLAATAGIYLLLRRHGETLGAPPASPRPVDRGALDHPGAFGRVLLALAAITLLARLLGGICRRTLRQPPVMGEILAGLLLGPSLLGAVFPAAYASSCPRRSCRRWA